MAIKRKKPLRGSPEELRATSVRLFMKAALTIARARNYELAARRAEAVKDKKLKEIWPEADCKTCNTPGKHCALHNKEGSGKIDA